MGTGWRLCTLSAAAGRRFKPQRLARSRHPTHISQKREIWGTPLFIRNYLRLPVKFLILSGQVSFHIPVGLKTGGAPYPRFLRGDVGGMFRSKLANGSLLNLFSGYLGKGAGLSEANCF